MKQPYITPVIETLSARQIIESMGPVSCGSGAGLGVTPASTPADVFGRGTGYSHLS